MTLGVLFSISSFLLLQTYLECKGFQINLERAPWMSVISRELIFLSKKVFLLLGKECRLILTQFSLQFQKDMFQQLYQKGNYGLGQQRRCWQYYHHTRAWNICRSTRAGRSKFIILQLYLNKDKVQQLRMNENLIRRQEFNTWDLDHQQLEKIIQHYIYEKVNTRVQANLQKCNRQFLIQGSQQNEPVALTLLCQLNRRQSIFEEQKNKLVEHYEDAIAFVQGEGKKRESETERKAEEARKKLILNIEVLERQKKMLYNQVDKMKEQMHRLKLVLDQSNKKIVSLQKNNEKLQYQIQQKNRMINNISQDISEFCQEIADKNLESFNKLIKFSIQFDAEVQFKPKCNKQREKIIQEERNLASLVSSILTEMQKKQQANAGCPNDHNQEIQSQLPTSILPIQTSPEYTFLKQIKDLISKIGEKTKRLIQKKQQIQKKYEKQSKKYSQFLQQTDQRLKQCREKIKQLEKANEKSSRQTQRMERQIQQLKRQKQQNQDKYEQTNRDISQQLNCAKVQREQLDRKYCLLISDKQILLKKLQNALSQRKKIDQSHQLLAENSKHIKEELNEAKQAASERSKQLTRMTNQMAKMVEILHSNKQKTDKQREGLIKTVQRLEEQLKHKKQTISELGEKQRMQEQKFNKHISILTIEIQSLKQSISTLKNVITVKNQEKQSQPQLVDASVLQQMMDKTYEIRLENTKLKDLVDVLKIKNKELEEQKLREQQNWEKQKNGYILQIQNLNKYNQQIERAKIQLVKTTEGNIREISVLATQKQNLLLKIQQILKQCQEKQEQISTHKNQTNLRQISFLEAESAYLSLFENLQVSKLEIFVLSQLVANHRRQRQAFQDKCIQVSFLYPQQQFEQDEEVNDFRIKEAEIKTKRNNSSGEKMKLRKRRAENSIGCLVNTRKEKQNLMTQNSQTEQYLNKTFKIKNQMQQTQKNQVQQLNDIINYMVNYLKGYTRNGIRKLSWLGFQGEQHLRLIQSSKNIKQKYATFQRVRSLSQKNEVCKQLIGDYEKIVNFYFQFVSINQDSISLRKNDSSDKYNNQNTKVKSGHMRDSSYFSK